MHSSSSARRWLVLFAGCVCNFSLSATSSFSLFVRPIMDLTDWSQSAISLAYTVYILMICLVGIAVGALESRLRLRTLVCAGSALFGLGWVVSGFAVSPAMLCLGFGFLSGGGVGLFYNLAITNILKWFPERKGFASGILLGCAALGPVFCSPVATMLMSNGTVFRALTILGAFYGVLMLSVSWLVREAPPLPAPQSSPEIGSSHEVDYTWREMLKSPLFYLLYLMFVLACTPNAMMLGAAASIGREQAGMSQALASVAVSLLAVSNFSGRLFFGTLSDHLGRYKTLFLIICILLAAACALPFLTTPIPFLVAMCLVGACGGGGVMVLFPLVSADCFGLRHSGFNYPILFSAYSISCLLGPQLASLYRQTTGAYTMAFVWAAGMMAVSAILLGIVMKLLALRKQTAG